MEDIKYHKTDKGTPQGGLISPILANVYLHYVLDRYFEEAIKPNLKGEAYRVRYADGFIIMFQYENEAKLVYQMLIKRFKKFGLEMEETKTGKYTVGHKMSKKKKKIKKVNIKKYIKENRHKDIF